MGPEGLAEAVLAKRACVRVAEAPPVLGALPRVRLELGFGGYIGILDNGDFKTLMIISFTNQSKLINSV